MCAEICQYAYRLSTFAAHSQLCYKVCWLWVRDRFKQISNGGKFLHLSKFSMQTAYSRLTDCRTKSYSITIINTICSKSMCLLSSTSILRLSKIVINRDIQKSFH